MNVLSIDWDYFVNANLDERISLFPDGGVFSPILESTIWVNHYVSNQAKLEAIRTSNISKIKTFFKKNGKDFKDILVCNAHEHCYKFVKDHIRAGENLNLVNVDFHHDVYDNKTLNSGSWLKYLMSEYKGTFWWVRRATSQRPNNKQLKSMSLDDALSKHYDLVFICKSGLWSPPHLDNDFSDLVYCLQKNTNANILAENNILTDRYADMQEDIAQMREIQNRMFKNYKK